MKSFNPVQFRHQFPAITKNRVYLDSAATALKPWAVIMATQAYYQHNSARAYNHPYNTTDPVIPCEQARQRVADYLNAQCAEEIVWTRGTTEAINLVAQRYVLPRLKKGDEILVSEAEHHANLIPWLMVAEQTGAHVVKLPLTRTNLPDIAGISAYLTRKTAVLALGQKSNVTGGSPDLRAAIQAAHQHNAIVVVDGAQGVVHTPPDVQALDIDFYAFSAHKLYGPTGIGVLYAKNRLLAEMKPWHGGGKMLTHASFSGFTALPFPHCFEAGTPNIAGILGLNAALNWLKELDLYAAEQYACALANAAEQQLATLPGFCSYRVDNSSVLAFNFTDIHYSDLATLLSEQNIVLRAGQHCAQPLMLALGVSGTLRASFAPYNTLQDVDALYRSVDRAVRLLRDNP